MSFFFIYVFYMLLLKGSRDLIESSRYIYKLEVDFIKKLET